MDVIRDITGAEKVDLVGLCLGGALYDDDGDLPRRDRRRPASTPITLLNTMVDFAEPGALGVFTDEATVAKLERKMAKRGYLEADEMAGTFDMLRANDLIFNYVVSNWLMGQQPPAFDILAWNGDSTRMPAAMHSFYLRNCYVQNKFAKGELELAGQRLDLGDVDEDLYVVAAVNDHIVPWTVLVRDRATTSAGRPGSSCPAAVTSPASSTRRGPRRGSCPATSTRSPPKPGGRRPPACRARGGRTGPSGGHSAPETWSLRRRWAATAGPSSATAPATTSAPEKERTP